MMYKLGVVSISFRKYTPEEICQEMQKAGLSYVEWGSDSHAPCDDPQKLKALVELQQKYGIHCSSYGTYFRLGITPLHELDRYITAATVLGTDVLRLWCGSKGSADYTEEETAELFSLCREAAAIAEKRNVRLCMECHAWTFVDTKETALALMNAVNSPYFRMYWQPNHMCTVEENLAYASALSAYTENLHVFHWDSEHRYSLAEGVSDWRQYLNVLSGNHTLLLEFMPDDKLSALCAEAAVLKELVEG